MYSQQKMSISVTYWWNKSEQPAVTNVIARAMHQGHDMQKLVVKLPVKRGY